MRVFAGPNGSGKSTIINSVKKYKVNNIPIDFGIYINADEIAIQLRKGKASLRKYKVTISKSEFVSIALNSGLVGSKEFSEHQFTSCFNIENNSIILNVGEYDERLAQISAHVFKS